ncbi:MAG TPA: hypothetical protein VH643_16095 [Gemmataceae bacterium]
MLPKLPLVPFVAAVSSLISTLPRLRTERSGGYSINKNLTRRIAMPASKSLDELIAHKAIEFADQIKKAAAMADKEEEIRIEVEKQLAFIQKEAGIELHGKHEFTVAKGRVDSVYSPSAISVSLLYCRSGHLNTRLVHSFTTEL